MPAKITPLASLSNASAANWTQLDTIQGMADITFWCPEQGNTINVVTNATTATEANTEFTNGRYFQLPIANFAETLRMDPCKTWYRSGTTNTPTGKAIISW